MKAIKTLPFTPRFSSHMMQLNKSFQKIYSKEKLKNFNEKPDKKCLKSF